MDFIPTDFDLLSLVFITIDYSGVFFSSLLSVKIMLKTSLFFTGVK
jgi:hypothetical protein